MYKIDGKKNTIRNFSKSEGMSPIEFEMKKLWS